MTTDLLVGIVRDLDAPVDLFLSLEDLQSGGDTVRFVMFRMGGATTVLGWGHYTMSTRRFDLDMACRPRLSLISTLMRSLPVADFVYSANSVRDQIIEASGGRPTINPVTYLHTKYALAYEDGTVTAEEVAQRFPGLDLLDKWERWFYQSSGIEPVDEMEDPDRVARAREVFLRQRRAEVADYETRRNRTDTDRDTLAMAGRVVDRLVQISNDFASSVGRSQMVYPEYVAGLEACKAEAECASDAGSLVCGIYEHIASYDLR